MPMPVTIWFARSVMLSQACSSATGSTASTPISRPSIGLPVAHEPIAPAKAPVSIIPSTLMFSTPARSLTSSPVAASSSGIARRRRRADEHRGHLVGHRALSLRRIDPERGAGEHQDDQALDHEHERARHAGHELHVDAARAQEAEQQRGRETPGTEPRASRPTTRPSKP